ncbi:VOC family protein [Entomohabitans teleogrylli]|uniref:VOC family protein n=1 Tax=Entomohabitans teleogrylli TaxID=1384589 RepID=UPI00073D8193|nr:VOC family protein [Entomohabitans teleogrylli]
MKITHVALWTRDLNAQAHFWENWFSARVGEQYDSRNRPGFSSRFVHLAQGATIELMTLSQLADAPLNPECCGWAHIAVSVGDKAAVDSLAQRAQQEGILVSGPRYTGDGFYEAVLRDPDGNLVEITAE